MIPNRLDEPDAMAPTAPAETANEGPKRVLVHNSAQRAFQDVSSGDPESSRRDVSDGGVERFALENLPNGHFWWMPIGCRLRRPYFFCWHPMDYPMPPEALW